MGFRGEGLRNAEGLDTGRIPGRPGIRVYQDESGDWPQGVIELSNAIGGSDPATITLTTLVQYAEDFNGNPVVRSVGHDLTMTGAANLAAPAYLSLIESESPDGGWMSAAILGADVAYLPAQTMLDGPAGTGPDNLATRGHVATLGGMVERTTATGYSPGWGPWANGTWSDLSFYLRRDGMVVCTGLARYVGGAGATLQIHQLSGAYAPRNGRAHITTASLSGTPREVEVKAGGIFLRGAAPALNAYVAINAVWPGATATT